LNHFAEKRPLLMRGRFVAVRACDVAYWKMRSPELTRSITRSKVFTFAATQYRLQVVEHTTV
jgi:hypothetical protein